jgi:cyclopropane fatty-acyl-phospholipid synthase-like methyltransferase
MTDPVSRPASPRIIQRLGEAIYPAMAMRAGMQLDLFTPLAKGAKSTEEMAEALGVKPVKLAPLLYALVAAELLTHTDGRFANSVEAETFLVRGKPGYLGSMHGFFTDAWSAVFKTAETIRAGVPQAKHNFATMSEDEFGGLLRGLHPGAIAVGRSLVTHHGLANHHRVLDVGGGSGGVAIGACSEAPDLLAVVLDLPNVVPFTDKFITDAGLTARISSQAGDVVAQIPAGSFDAAVLRSFIQILSAGDAAKAIYHVGAALVPGAAIYIVGRILEDSRLAPPDTVTINLVFLNVYDDGQAYTAGEYTAWMTAAGFADVKIAFDALPGAGLITARKR